MWFMGEDGLMHQVRDCKHPVWVVESAYPATAAWSWCGLCGGVWR